MARKFQQQEVHEKNEERNRKNHSIVNKKRLIIARIAMKNLGYHVWKFESINKAFTNDLKGMQEGSAGRIKMKNYFSIKEHLCIVGYFIKKLLSDIRCVRERLVRFYSH